MLFRSQGGVWGITERSIHTHTHTHTHTRLTQTNTGNEGREGVENQTYTYILSDTQGGIKGQGGWKGPTCTSPDTPGGWMGERERERERERESKQRCVYS